MHSQATIGLLAKLGLATEVHAFFKDDQSHVLSTTSLAFLPIR